MRIILIICFWTFAYFFKAKKILNVKRRSRASKINLK